MTNIWRNDTFPNQDTAAFLPKVAKAFYFPFEDLQQEPNQYFVHIIYQLSADLYQNLDSFM